MTIYKQIPGYERLYEAGDDGSIWTCQGKTTYRTLSDGTIQSRIWSRKKLKQKIEIRPRSKHSDCRVDLWKNGKHKTYLVSRLVAMTFIANPRHKPCINHIDGNPLNNRPGNLEWCTYKENNTHALNNRLNKHSKVVILSSKNSNLKNVFVSMTDASKWLGFNRGYISGLLNKGVTSVDEYNISIESW